jgi:hypothetical protein
MQSVLNGCVGVGVYLCVREDSRLGPSAPTRCRGGSGLAQVSILCYNRDRIFTIAHTFILHTLLTSLHTHSLHTHSLHALIAHIHCTHSLHTHIHCTHSYCAHIHCTHSYCTHSLQKLFTYTHCTQTLHTYRSASGPYRCGSAPPPHTRVPAPAAEGVDGVDGC